MTGHGRNCLCAHNALPFLCLRLGGLAVPPVCEIGSSGCTRRATRAVFLKGIDFIRFAGDSPDLCRGGMCGFSETGGVAVPDSRAAFPFRSRDAVPADREGDGVARLASIPYSHVQQSDDQSGQIAMPPNDVETPLIGRVQQVAATLTETEQRLVTELMRNPQEIALGTSAAFAARIGAHEATTSRLARKLGFANYAAFRTCLRDEFVQRAAPAQRLSTTLSEAQDKGYLSVLLNEEMAALGRLRDFVTETHIAEASALLDRERVFVFAHGNAKALAVMMDRRLRRMAIGSRVLHGSARDLAEGALALGRDDVLLAFAFRRQPAGYARLIEVARQAGTATLAVSDTLGPSLRPAPDLLLAAPRSGAPEGFQTLTVPMAICNALVLALAARRGPAALRELERLGTLIGRFESEGDAS
ncbi:MurR/RpiR family transcriptional regulator [Marinivivus vitaminiproducens]|uniref:MurR/RpiR family transcriptional regulator n=1 Tax=Marinivivus vitaminiproducens TaxID=3035935 RepID=UPI0027A542D0|nr:MurR/RpiR family transcriptional regulator [Geminicoccaceae bacterium SCSIO 64248]